MSKQPLPPLLAAIYARLFARFGPQHWWPGETPFEVSIGAILTQNTNWRNVERAIANMKQAGIMSADGILEADESELAELIRPSGYFRQKAARLKIFCRFLEDNFGGEIERMADCDIHALRKKLLSVNGIGPETADSIILYAAQKPVFVIDAYTIRVLSRHGIIEAKAGYHHVQELFHANLAPDAQLFNEYHALIVRLCKEHCTKKPVCDGCPLQSINNPSQPSP
ncbi:MAG: endonuclease III domain-containing protein [Nitrospirae bacterium]|nr:endonuclease III domain-containing protein [Nitrospirota bacterium]